MRLDEVRRRNRRRSVVAASAAAMNYWVLVGFLWSAGIATIMNKLDRPLTVPVAIALGAACGAVTVVWYLRRGLRRMRDDVVGRVGTPYVEETVSTRLANVIDGLAVATGGAPVKTVVIDDPAPNALTIGVRPDRTTIVVTRGLVEQLSRDELEAVLAVQYCEIRRLDVMLRTVVHACTHGAIHIYRAVRPDSYDPRRWIVPALIAPSMIAARVIRSRSRRAADFGADDMAIAITRHPQALVDALRTLRADPQIVAVENADLGDLWFEPAVSGVDSGRRVGQTNDRLEGRIARLARRDLPR